MMLARIIKFEMLINLKVIYAQPHIARQKIWGNKLSALTIWTLYKCRSGKFAGSTEIGFLVEFVSESGAAAHDE